MIKITDYRGRTHYLHPDAIAKLSEAAVSSQWHGIRCVVTCFDKTVIEACNTVDMIVAELVKVKGGTK